MKANLLSPMQMRDNDVRVNDEPKHMAPTPMDNHHAIVAPMPDLLEEPLRIPLSIHGATSYFPTRRPTKKEWENLALAMQVELTSELPEWDSTTTRFKEQEAVMIESEEC